MKRGKSWRPIMVLTVSLALCRSLCLAGLFTVRGSSMEPGLKNGEKVWIRDYPKGADPARGDIIAFTGEDKTVSIKRVIGLPHETVIIKDGFVFIASPAGHPAIKLDEPYLAPGTVTEPEGEFPVPGGHYFVLGDKRDASLDSRKFGCVPRQNVAGKATRIL